MGIARRRAEGKTVGRLPGTSGPTQKEKEMKIKIQELSQDFNGNKTDKYVIE